MGELVLVRHGETEWSRQGRHTGRTDVPLTPTGRAEAARLPPLLADFDFVLARSSPLARAADTARIALGRDVPADERLVEWDYGEVEGRTTADYRRSRPDWLLWRDGCPGGESVADVGHRVDALLADVVPALVDGDVLLVAHGHLLRVLAARRLGLAPTVGACFILEPAAVSVLGTEHEIPAVRRWNIAPPE
jgi:broad specificity phosphatase PhoE